MRMNSKAFAIFVGAIMVLSAFASFVLRGNDQTAIPVNISASDLQAFGVQGNLVDWNFNGLKDVLEMAPNSTVMAYWINLSASDNLTRAARAALPQSVGLQYGSQLYRTSIEKLAYIDFNGTWAELHLIQPYNIGSNSLVIDYDNYMMYPTGPDFVTVLGRPTVFGSQSAVPQVIDVITGGVSAEGIYSLVDDDHADLQVAALGSGGASLPLSGAYKELSLGVNASRGQDTGCFLKARLVQPEGNASQRLNDIATTNNLSYASEGSDIEISGMVAEEKLQNVLTAILGP
jgi:hypothetical protein